jgi:cytochrome c oxidase subunit 2
VTIDREKQGEAFLFALSIMTLLQNQSPSIPFSGIPVHPPQASTFAKDVDGLHFYISAVTVFFSILIFSLVLYFAVKYRRRTEDERPLPIFGSTKLEILWSAIPLVIAMSFFFWGAKTYYHMLTMPEDAEVITVVGKQWMWKIQHPGGQREINELHVPVGRKIRLRLVSEDVIHSFYIPAFRIKKDVLPGREQNPTELWFEATQVGEYHLFCAEYCGTKHAGMGGRVIVMEPADYEAWLTGAPQGETLEQAGARLYRQFNCNTCHDAGAASRGPVLPGLFGKPVKLQNGVTVTADEAYLHESIVQPNAKVVAGYEPVMPTYQGLVTEEQVLQLIAYIKSLTREERAQVQK